MEWFKKEGIEWIKAIAIGFLVFLIIRTFFFSNYVVEGSSMMPTLQDGNKLIVNKFVYKISDLERFDVIVFHANENEDYVKRVIGLPGDTIEYKDDKLYINGKYYEEPYLDRYKSKYPGRTFTGDFTLLEKTGYEKVPDGMVFVLGDNRLGSWDSRHFGFVSIDQIVGEVNVRYWPFNQWGFSF